MTWRSYRSPPLDEVARDLGVEVERSWDGIGVVGGDALRASMAARGLPWGPPQGGVSR